MTLRLPFVLNSAGYHEEIPAADALSLPGGATAGAALAMGANKVTGVAAGTAAGDALMYGQGSAVLAGLALTAALAMGANLITGLATPVSATDAATKGYVDGIAQGLQVKTSARALAASNITLSGTQTIDGVAVIASDRVLVTGQTTGSQNGLYVVAAGAWARAADMAATTHAGSSFVFISEGTANADTGWVVTTDAPNDVVGTNTLAFTQFSGAGAIAAGSGLTKTGTTLSVNVLAASGTAIVSGNVAVKLAGTNPGLQLASDGVALLPDPNGGLTTGAAGSKLLLNGTTLQMGAAGVSVKGVGSLWEINATATSSNVTAGNLNTLTGGSSSDASSLHTHSTLVIGGTQFAALSVGALSIADPVYQSSTNDQVDKARADTVAKSWVVGLVAAAVSAGASATVYTSGKVASVLSGATAGARYYLQATGGIGTTAPSSGNRLIQVGYAVNATDLRVGIIDYGSRA
jgi:hypothetical protein